MAKSNRRLDYRRAQVEKKNDPSKISQATTGFVRVRSSRSTFTEDPLPDRPMKVRKGVTLPKLKCLEEHNS